MFQQGHGMMLSYELNRPFHESIGEIPSFTRFSFQDREESFMYEG